MIKNFFKLINLIFLSFYIFKINSINFKTYVFRKKAFNILLKETKIILNQKLNIQLESYKLHFNKYIKKIFKLYLTFILKHINLYYTEKKTFIIKYFINICFFNIILLKLIIYHIWNIYDKNINILINSILIHNYINVFKMKNFDINTFSIYIIFLIRHIYNLVPFFNFYIIKNNIKLIKILTKHVFIPYLNLYKNHIKHLILINIYFLKYNLTNFFLLIYSILIFFQALIYNF